MSQPPKNQAFTARKMLIYDAFELILGGAESKVACPPCGGVGIPHTRWL